MTRVVDLHPEGLLDRDAHGELTPDEEARLAAHLEVCAACRFERQLRADFAEELASDATPSERIALAGLSQPEPEAKVERASVPAPAPLPVLEPLPAPPPSSRRSSRRRATRATWLLAAAALLLVSVAGATGAGQRAWSRLIGPPALESVPGETSATATARRAAAHRPAVASTPVAEPPGPPEPAPNSAVDVEVLAPPPSPPVAAPKLPVAVGRSMIAHAGASRSSGTRSDAAALFEAATEARRQGSYARAIDLQRQLLDRYPHTREAHVTRETMGRLLLDRGDPAGACASFESYLADGSGELGEEAMVGRATALERLGRTAQAADAWRSLIAAYPETAYSAHAQSRLGGTSVR
jgi:TolA-binding protein